MADKHEVKRGEIWAEAIRAAIRSSPLSQYAICQAANIERSMLARFMQGAGISLATAERIGRVVGVELSVPKKARKRE